MGVFAARFPSLRLPLRLNRTTLFDSSSDANSTQASPPNLHFSVEYLVSCGLSSDEALSASKLITHIKSPENPDMVLQFLREIGISESDIRAAVSRDPRILCSNLEKNWKPNIGKLQEVGISVEDISGILAQYSSIFRSNFVTKIDFWMGILGSVEILSQMLRMNGALLKYNLESNMLPKLSFFREQCGFSLDQVRRFLRLYPSVISLSTEKLKIKAKMVEELGIERSSGSFLLAFGIVCMMNQTIIDAKINNLKRIGFLQEEVALMVSKAPSLLGASGEHLGTKMKFLINEASCDKIDVIQNPFLLMCSMENRMIPRNAVRKLLMSKGFPVANLKFSTFVQPSEEEFVKKFIKPYEHTIPKLHQIYVGASRKKISGIE